MKVQGGPLWLLLSYLMVVQAARALSNPRIVEHPENQYVVKNEPATLNCKAEGNPTPMITWYRNGRPVSTAKDNPSSHRMLLPSGQLFFLRIIHNKNNKPDVGVYYCNATNTRTGQSTISKNATLEIAVLRDEFKVNPKDTIVAVGQNALLECRAPRGLPEPRIKWKKDGEIKQAGGRVTIQDNGNLNIENTQKDDSGEYVCIASNIAGDRESLHADLSVQEKPKVTKAPQDVLIEQDENVVFECRVSGDPAPIVRWRKEDGQLPQGRSKVMDDNTLKIERVKVGDEGSYVCRAENDVGAVEATGRLTVHSHPSFVVTPRDKVVGVGRTVSLRCEVTGNPPPAVFWNKETSQILMFPRQDHGRFSVTDQGTLVISPAKREDEGEYVCQALSVAGSAFAKASIQVKDVDPRPPPIIHLGPQNQTLPLNSMATLQCQASGDPMPTIRWFKNTVPVPADSRRSLLTSGALQISDLRSSDTGFYSCKATSETGETTWGASLAVEAPSNKDTVFRRTPEPSTFPGPPSRPGISEIGKTSMRLTWQPSTNQGASPVFAYTVEYFSHETGQGWVTASGIITDTTYLVKGLHAGTSYMFLVRAQNSHGLSLPSPVSGPVRTAGGMGLRPTLAEMDLGLVEEKLSGPVVTINRAEALDPTTIKLNWSILKSHRYIEGFHIKYRETKGNQKNSQVDVPRQEHYNVETVTSNTATMYVLRHLNRYTWYMIRVQPFYRQVEGQDSNTVKVRTLEAAPTAPPQHVLAYFSANTSIQVEWSPPPPGHLNGPLRGYKVFCLGNETKFHHNVTIPDPHARRMVIPNLVKGMAYKVQVAAYNRKGVGVMSDPKYLGGEATAGLIQGIVKEPWFIATLIGVIGGILWVSLCVFSVWLYRKRKTRKKLQKTDKEEQARMASYLNTPNYLHKDVRQAAPDLTNMLEKKGDGVKENMYNPPGIPLKTFYSKNNSLPVAPYATTTLVTQQQAPDAMFQPIPDGYVHQNSTSSDSCIKPDLSSDSNCTDCSKNTELHFAELPLYLSGQESLLGSPCSDVTGITGKSLKQPALDWLPPPPQHPPSPTDVDSAEDSDQFDRNERHTDHPRGPSPPHLPLSDYDNGVSPTGHWGQYSPLERVPHERGDRTLSPQGDSRSHSPKNIPQSPRGHNRSMSPRSQVVYSPRSVSESERGPTPPIRAYKLVPLKDHELQRLSDSERGPTPPVRMIMTVPNSGIDPMTDRACQSSLPSLVSDYDGRPLSRFTNGGNGPDLYIEVPEGRYPNDRHSPPLCEEGLPRFGDDPHVEHTCRPECGTPESSVGGDMEDSTVSGSMLAGWASMTDNGPSDSSGRSSTASSSDGSFFAEADFASAVAKAAELSGLTVVGSTVSDPNPKREKVRKPAKHRERPKRPVSPYSTDSNFSAVAHKPYPKSQRRKQMQDQGNRYNTGNAPSHRNQVCSPTRPKAVSDNGNFPAYTRPSFPSPTCTTNGNGNSGGCLSNTSTRTQDNVMSPTSPSNQSRLPGSNPLVRAFDSADAPIV